MKKLLLSVVFILSIGVQANAGNGDLIVDGNLGVGTPAPSAKLEIQTHGTANSMENALRLHYPNFTGGGYSGTILSFSAQNSLSVKTDYAAIAGAIYSNAAGAEQGLMTFATVRDGALSEKMRIDQNGNVGIGTTNPVGKLDVRGGTVIAGFASGQLKIAGGTVDGGIWTGADDLMRIADWNTGARGMVVNLTSGNVGIGTTTPNGKLDVYGSIAVSGTVVHSSDIKFKKNLLPITTPLDKVLNLNGLTYEWKTEEYKEKGFPEGRHYGVIAQEIEKVLPEVVNTAPDGTKAVAYTEIIPVLIEAIKEQQKRIDLLEQRLEGIRK